MSRMIRSRRQFLRESGGFLAGVGASLTLPAAVYRTVLGSADQPAPSERVRIGCIGVGNQGRGNMKQHLKNVVAVCDVDKTRLGEAKGQVEKVTGKGCEAYGDYSKCSTIKMWMPSSSRLRITGMR